MFSWGRRRQKFSLKSWRTWLVLLLLVGGISQGQDPRHLLQTVALYFDLPLGLLMNEQTVSTMGQVVGKAVQTGQSAVQGLQNHEAIKPLIPEALAHTGAGQYRVEKVLDGDTFQATDGHVSFRVRMAAVDAPESTQPYGDQAKAYLQRSLEGQMVQLKTLKKTNDLYNRVIALVYKNNREVGQELVQKGLATYYRPTCKDYPADARKYDFAADAYVQSELEARHNRVGMWESWRVQLPCEYRREQKAKKNRS